MQLKTFDWQIARSTPPHSSPDLPGRRFDWFSIKPFGTADVTLWSICASKCTFVRPKRAARRSPNKAERLEHRSDFAFHWMAHSAHTTAISCTHYLNTVCMGEKAEHIVRVYSRFALALFFIRFSRSAGRSCHWCVVVVLLGTVVFVRLLSAAASASMVLPLVPASLSVLDAQPFTVYICRYRTESDPHARECSRGAESPLPDRVVCAFALAISPTLSVSCRTCTARRSAQAFVCSFDLYYYFVETGLLRAVHPRKCLLLRLRPPRCFTSLRLCLGLRVAKHICIKRNQSRGKAIETNPIQP